MGTDVPPPHLGDITDELPAEPGDIAQAFLRAREAAARGAVLREGGDEVAAVTAETSSRSWLRKFAMLNDRLAGGGSANQDFPVAKL
jgi:hypothetical protein